MTINSESVIIITGASSGMGAALAVLLGERNARIALVARRTDKLLEVAERVSSAGGTPLVITADVSQEAECASVVQATLDAFGTVDVLVNNAGRGNRASVEDTTTADLDAMFRLNVYSQFWLTARVLPIMKTKRSGHIVNISSFAGKVGFPYNAAYVAAKHAVVGFTASLRAELIETGVEATCVCPAGITTDWADVSDGGPIGDVFAHGIKASRTIARERALPLAPLTRMISAESAAEMLFNVIEGGRTDDVFTHDDTREQAILATSKRCVLEDKMLPLFLGMRQAYEELP
ncbi:MAG: SDR family NAD(P)-dependent oxidoreductase [bacterium]|nr:SDR family NAD(P)-dependent oxidoreductase [bacterium]